jgi:adenosylcobinamide kinase/adenosylcobinamide-phosphate guanylyltransferase
VPLDLVGVLRDLHGHDGVVVIDCLTLWLSNLLTSQQAIEDAIDALVAELADTTLEVAVVSNEVGQGVVPMHALTRAFRDHQGRLNQRVAAVADRVRLLVAGIEVPVKG